MIVFSNYLKILKQYSAIIIIYTVIFTSFSVIFTIYNKSNNTFTPSKPDIAIINNDNSKLIDSFLNYIKKTSNIINMESKDLKDALFYRKVDLILTIPTNFTNDFLNGLNPLINIKRVPDSYDSTYAIMYLNRYLNIANLYNKNNVSLDNLIGYIESDIKHETNIVLTNDNISSLTNANYFYNFSNYTILSISVTIIGMVMSSFKKNIIKKRNIISSLPYGKINNSLFLGNLFAITSIWLLYIIISIIFFSNAMFSLNGIILIINLFVFSITALSIGFLVGNIIHNKEVISAIVNVVALGSSFICGAFVPQEILGNTVLTIAKFFPSYWFIKNNNEIVLLNSLSISKLAPIIMNMVIILLFGILFFIINKVILKFKLKQN